MLRAAPHNLSDGIVPSIQYVSMSRPCFTGRLFFVSFISAKEAHKMAEKTVSNLVFRVVLDGAEEVLGVNGVKAILNFSGLSDLLVNRPDYSFDKNFTDDQLRGISSSFAAVLGMDGARAVFRLIGKASGKKTIEVGVYDSIKDLPPDEKLFKAVGLYAMVTGRGTVSKEGDVIVYDNPQCSVCKDVTYDQPICSIYNGYFDSLIEWMGIKR